MDKPKIDNPYVMRMRDAVVSYWESCKDAAETFYKAKESGIYSDMHLAHLAEQFKEVIGNSYNTYRHMIEEAYQSALAAVKLWETADGANLVKADVDLLNSGIKLSAEDVFAMCERNRYNATMLRLINQKVKAGTLALSMEAASLLANADPDKKREMYSHVHTRALALMDNLKSFDAARFAAMLHSDYAELNESRYMDFCNPEKITAAAIYDVIGDGSELRMTKAVE